MSSASGLNGDNAERQAPVAGEATPEQPVVQRAGPSLTDTDDVSPSPGSPGI